MACAATVSTVAAFTAAMAAPAANTPAPAPPAAGAPANLHAELGAVTITRGQVADGTHYVSPNPAQAYDRKSHDVGWFSHDTTMGKKDGPTLHYGAHNVATYAFGTGTPGSRGTFWTPALAVSPKSACTVSFVHSYALADASRLSIADVMTFSYSFDNKTWVDEALPKPAVTIPWTTFTKTIPCQGHDKVLLGWDFDSKDGVNNKGRGWNLKSFDLKQN
jgi:hypothetical protein